MTIHLFERHLDVVLYNPLGVVEKYLRYFNFSTFTNGERKRKQKTSYISVQPYNSELKIKISLADERFDLLGKP